MCRHIFTNARIERHKLHTCTYFNMISFCIAHSALLLLLFPSASLHSLHGITHTYKRCTALTALQLQLACSCISTKILIEADCQQHELLENNGTNNASKSTVQSGQTALSSACMTACWLQCTSPQRGSGCTGYLSLAEAGEAPVANLK